MEIHQGDCLEVLRGMPADSVDSVVTDPPAGIAFMGKEWDHHKGGRDQWVTWLATRLAECFRVAKPGAHALVWALPRTSHWTATAIEDAGWVIEDRVAHIFGTGFPKHKSKLKPAVEDWWLATKPGGEKWLGVDACRIATNGERLGGGSEKFDGNTGSGYDRPCRNDPEWQAARAAEMTRRVEKATALGRWPTNLVLSHHPECNPNGVKVINGNGHWPSSRGGGSYKGGFLGQIDLDECNAIDVIEAFDCHPDCPVRLIDEQSGICGPSGSLTGDELSAKVKNTYGDFNRRPFQSYGDSGGASRFFPGFLYCPKANRKDRGEGNTHPTVKAEPLMRWLCKLVTPPGGTVLDPFAGSGSTGFAAEAEGFQAILIEQDAEYIKIIRKRIDNFLEETPLFRS